VDLSCQCVVSVSCFAWLQLVHVLSDVHRRGFVMVLVCMLAISFNCSFDSFEWLKNRIKPIPVRETESNRF
jgi:hypothetical protein